MAKLNRGTRAAVFDASGQVAPESSGLRERKSATVNEEGGLAFKMTPEVELLTRVMTCMVGEPKFYDSSGSEHLDAVVKLVGKVAKTDPELVLKMAAYARNQMYLRTIPQVMLVEATAHEGTKKFVRKYTPSIVRRADELAEVVSYYIQRFGEIGDGKTKDHPKAKKAKGMLCNSLKRGLGDAFHQFDSYALAKYDRDGPVKLKDVIRIVHPKPQDKEQGKMWKMLLNRELPPPATWEVALSTKGASKETWEGIIPKMGYMALLRNLRNFTEKGVELDAILKKLTDPEEVKRSKQLPFRFWSAYAAVAEAEGLELDWQEGRLRWGRFGGSTSEKVGTSNKVLRAMQTCLEASVQNLPTIPGKTFMTADNSGSMSSPISERSKVQKHHIANLLQSMANRISDEAITSVFGETFKVVHADPSDGIITNMRKFRATDVDHSTNAWLSVEWLNKQKVVVDRIILFSDMQCYSTHGEDPEDHMGSPGQSLAEQFWAYKKNINPNCMLYSIDLAGYGTAQFPKTDKNVVTLAGWSEKLLEFIKRYEQRGEGQLTAIQEFKALEVRKPKSWFPKEADDGDGKDSDNDT
jgi:hypothetical protein